jgi:hypothetical protein
MQPAQGDRIKVLNIPEGYPWADLYASGVIDTDLDGNVIHENGVVGFFTSANHFPYKDNNGKVSISGCGNCVHISKLKYIETKPGIFWKFKDGIPRAGGAEYYEEPVNYFECEFTDLN